MPVQRSLNQNFFKKWSCDMAYVLGFFAADGSMLRNSRGAHFIEFTVVDQVLLTHIQKVAGSDHTLSIRERGGNCKTAYRLQIGSKTWFEDLTHLGFTQGKSKTLQFPAVPEEYLADFIRGYFDGDGCVHFKQYWSKERQKLIWVFMTLFTSGSKKFLEYLHSELRRNGIRGGTIHTKVRGFELVFSRNDSLALYKLIYHTDPATRFCLPRKYRLFTKALKTLYGNKYVRS